VGIGVGMIGWFFMDGRLCSGVFPEHESLSHRPPHTQERIRKLKSSKVRIMNKSKLENSKIRKISSSRTEFSISTLLSCAGRQNDL
jgi:hypothetical protein